MYRKIYFLFPALLIALNVSGRETFAGSFFDFIPDPAAVVNGEEIPSVDVMEEYTLLNKSNRLLMDINVETLKKSLPDMVKKAVERKLVLTEASGRGISPSREQTAQYILDDYAGKNDAEKTRIDTALKKSGITIEQYAEQNAGRSEVQYNVVKAKLFSTAGIPPRPEISDEDIVEYKKNNPDYFCRVRASHIYVSTYGMNESQKAEARKKAEELLIKAKKRPDTFADLAKEYSDCPSGIRGGDLGKFGRGVMWKEFEDAVFSLQQDEIYPEVVTSRGGFHIIKLNARIEEPESALLAKSYIEEDRKKEIHRRRQDYLKELEAKYRTVYFVDGAAKCDFD